jgi:formylmethanofuran dehydrogenase subunit E
LVEQDSPEPKVKVFIPMYLPLQTSKCEKCGEVIAQPKELIKIVKSAEI